MNVKENPTGLQPAIESLKHPFRVYPESIGHQQDTPHPESTPYIRADPIIIALEVTVAIGSNLSLAGYPRYATLIYPGD
jgi:hypothetical protein